MTLFSIIFQSIFLVSVLFLVNCQKMTHHQDLTLSPKTKIDEPHLQQEESAYIKSQGLLKSNGYASQSIKSEKVRYHNRAMYFQNLKNEQLKKKFKSEKDPSQNFTIYQERKQFQETRLLQQIQDNLPSQVPGPLTETKCDFGLTKNDQGQCVSCGQFCFECTFNSETKLTECIECYPITTDYDNQIYPLILYNKKCYKQNFYSGFMVIVINQTYDKFFTCPSFCRECFITNGNYECTYFEQEYGANQVNQTNFDFVNFFPCHGICSLCTKVRNQSYKCQKCPASYFKLGGSCSNCLQSSENKCFQCEVNNYQFTCTDCIQNYFIDSNKCTICSKNCERCTSPQICSSCYPGYHLHEKQQTKAYCVICPQGCLKCSYNQNNSICTQCYPGYYLKYESKCQPCAVGCQICKSPDLCYICISGYVMLNGLKCVQKVEKCVSYRTSNGQCTQCAEGYQVVDNQCIYNQSLVNGLQYACQQQQYLQNLICKNVSNLIQNCIEYNKYYCTRCKIGYFLDYVDETEVQICSVCQLENCMNCKNNVLCRKCYDGYFLDKSNNYEKCIKCFESCKTCIAKPTFCLSCKEGFYMTNSMICASYIQFKFKLSLGTDFFIIDNLLNDIKDRLVSISYDQNTSIGKDAKQRYLQFTNISVGPIRTLIQTVIEGYISYPDADQIKQIYTRTKQYLSNEQVAIEMNIMKVSFSQIKYCPVQHKYDQQTKSCNHLDIQHCAIYDQQNDNLTCKQCEVNLSPKLNNTFCSMNCSSLSNCQICYNLTQCFICQDEFVNLNGKCFAQIPYCILYNGTDGSCQKCNDSKPFLSKTGFNCYQQISYCMQYGNQGNCAICDQYFRLSNLGNTCQRQISGCISYEDKGTCAQCSQNMRVSNNKSECQPIINDCQSYTDMGRCEDCILKNNPNGQSQAYKIIYGTCQYLNFTVQVKGQVLYGPYHFQCMQGCLQCKDPYSCEKCLSNGYYISKVNDSNSICLKCVSPCATCSENGSCLSCYDGFTLNQTSHQCKICASSLCLTCSPNDLSNCSKCVNSYFLSNGICNACSDGCKTCNSSSTCTECDLGYLLVSTSNLTQCSRCSEGCSKCTTTSCSECYHGYFKSSGTCTKCKRNCWTCTSSSDCSECMRGFKLVQNECLENIENCRVYNASVKVCKQCYFGYKVNSTNGLCIVNESQGNLYQTIYPCNKQNYLETGTSCNVCPSSYQNCEKCNEKVCLKCSKGFYLTTSLLCTSCQQTGCKDCFSGILCKQCSAGYYLSSISQISLTEVAGTCLACNSNCLTCYDSSTYCTSCNSSYILSSSAVCIPNNILTLTVKFDYQYEKVHQILNTIILEIINQLPGASNFTDEQKKTKKKLLQITKISNGSVVVDGYFGFTQISQLTKTKSNLQLALAPGKTFAGIEVISSVITDNMIIILPILPITPCQTENCLESTPKTFPIYAIIIIACGGGFLLIGMAVLIFYLRKMYSNEKQQQEKTDSTKSNKEKGQNPPIPLSSSLDIIQFEKNKDEKNDELENISQGSAKKFLQQNQQKWVHHNAI